MTYIDEEAWIGTLGHVFVIVAFVAAFFAGISYAIGAQKEDDAWRNLGRRMFYIHTIAVWGIFTTLLCMLIYHKNQYQYVWQHSSKSMDMKYILACMWEGQEGSFLLWLFWHTVIGLVLRFTARKWEAPVMAVIMLVQVFISSMLLGFYIGDIHIGSSPFLLMRELPQNLSLPWAKNLNYMHLPQMVQYFSNSRGLNPLLQNYWMTIHPPTLFLGFALTVVPFAFSMAALWKRKYNEWQQTALPWTFVGIAVLGTGILMGGAWAYEALSFGGFWAWDPVENASLVPWLTLVGAGHVMLLYRLKGRSVFTTFFLSIVTFLLILYSTFLTRSGILGTTSVHAFTDLGMSGQLILYLAVFVWLAVTLMVINIWLRWSYGILSFVFLLAFLLGNNHTGSMVYFLLLSFVVLVIGYVKFFPGEKDEENLWSREFWMFVGAVVLLISACQVAFFTSIPVINKFLKVENIHKPAQWLADKFPSNFTTKLAEANMAPQGDMIYFYNKWQLPFAVLVCFIAAFAQFLKYKKSTVRELVVKTFWPFLIALLIGVAGAVYIYFHRKFTIPVAGLQGEFKLWLTSGILILFMSMLLIFFSKLILNAVKALVKNELFYALSVAAYAIGVIFALFFVYRCFDKATDCLTPESSKAFVLGLWCSLLLFAGSFTVLSNTDYIISILKGKFKAAGPSIAHIGFGLLLLGALISTSRKQVISRNVTNQDLTKIDSAMSNESNILITQGDTLPMGNYYVTFVGREKKGIYIHFNVDYYERNPQTNKLDYKFRLSPMVQLNKIMGNAFEPDTKHYLHKDVYTHVVQADLSDPKDSTKKDDWSAPQNNHVKQGDTIAVSNAMLVLDTIVSDMSNPQKINVGAVFSVYDKNIVRHVMRPTFNIVGNSIVPVEARNDTLGLKLTLWKVYPEDGSFDVYVSEKISMRRESIVMKAEVFPGINILWLGCIIMVIGTVIAIVTRILRDRKSTAAADEN